MNKPVDTFKNRFNIAISNANIKPAELAEKTKLSKSTISHYMSGYTQPKSDKLFTLSKALNVNEAWLMGFDVPMEQSTEGTYTKYVSADSIAFEITGRSLQHSPQIFDAICNSLKEVLKDNLIDYTNGTQTLNAIEILKSPDISYNKKAAALRRIINMVLINTEKNTIHLFYAADKTPREQQIDTLFSNIQDLNDANLRKVSYYSESLLKVQKMEEEQLHLMPDAAHDRTDINPTDEIKKHDDDLMDNDEFWGK